MPEGHEMAPQLTPDEPYRPSMGNEADDRAILSATRPDSPQGIDPHKAARWEPPQGREGRSLLPPPRRELLELVGRIRAKLALGEQVTAAELETLQLEAACRLLTAPRSSGPAWAARALDRLQRRRRERELEQRRFEEDKANLRFSFPKRVRNAPLPGGS